MDMKQFATSMISQNPQISNNPQAKELISVIQSGDNERGQQIAKNLCSTYGITIDQASQQAKQFFKLS